MVCNEYGQLVANVVVQYSVQRCTARAEFMGHALHVISMLLGLGSGPSTERGLRHTVSKLGQGGKSSPPPKLVRSTGQPTNVVSQSCKRLCIHQKCFVKTKMHEIRFSARTPPLVEASIPNNKGTAPLPSASPSSAPTYVPFQLSRFPFTSATPRSPPPFPSTAKLA